MVVYGLRSLSVVVYLLPIIVILPLQFLILFYFSKEFYLQLLLYASTTIIFIFAALTG